MTTTNGALIELAEKCETAPGPDRKLDEAIALASGLYITKRGREGQFAKASEPNLYRFSVTAFTASLDAAMTLVPEGWRLAGLSEPGDGAKCASAAITNLPAWQRGEAATPVLAICAAALRARAGHRP